MENTVILIPARRNSKGAPFKNRKLLKYTLDIIPPQLSNMVFVSTDDEEIIDYCNEYGVKYIKRPDKYSDDLASMRQVLEHFVEVRKLKSNFNILTLYLTYPNRQWEHVEKAFDFFIKSGARSLLCKKEPQTSPFLCFYETSDKHGYPIVQKNYYRRQDHPKTFEASHYIIIDKVSEISNLTHNLYNSHTVFFDLKNANVLDIDLKDQLDKFLSAREDDAEKQKEEMVTETTVSAPKPEIKILVLGDYKNLKNINFAKIPNDVVTVGLDRSWILYKPNYYYTDDIFNLIELTKHKGNSIHEYKIIGSDRLVQSAKSSKRFNTIKDLLKRRILTINNRTEVIRDIDDLSGLIDVFRNQVFKNYDCHFYLAGLGLEYKGPGQTFIWEGTKVKPIQEFNVDTLHAYNSKIMSNVELLKTMGYSITSVMTKSNLNNVLDYKAKFVDVMRKRPHIQMPPAPDTSNVRVNENLRSTIAKHPGRILEFEEFKRNVEGKRVALVANSKELFSMGLGEYIDDHDIVVRFNSFVIDQHNSGTKMDMHASIYLESMHTNIPVQYRFIVSVNKSNWQKTVDTVRRYNNSNIVDIHWPLKQGFKRGFKSSIPTTGLNTLFLFLMCGNYEELNMIGFNFYENGINSIGRHSSTGLCMSSVHEYDYEKEWVLNHAKEYDDKIIKF